MKIIEGNPLGDTDSSSQLSERETGCLGGRQPSVPALMQTEGHAGSWLLRGARGWTGDPELPFPPAES